MKEISYANEKILTSTIVADAVMRYAASLGENANADTVEIPIIDQNGTAGSMELLIGPASQLTSRPMDSEFPEPDGEGLVAELDGRMRRLKPFLPAPVAEAGGPIVPEYPTDDD